VKVVFIFLDGVGVGKDDPKTNPWTSVSNGSIIPWENHPATYPGAYSKPLDACLGVEGLPQSATGTTALLTGINAPQHIGQHKSGFPSESLQKIILEHSIHKQAAEAGLVSTFANAYNNAYFERPLNRQSVTTHAVLAAGIPFRMMDEYVNGCAIFHDLTGEMIREQGNGDKLSAPSRLIAKRRKKQGYDDTFSHIIKTKDLPIIDPAEAGKRIAGISKEYDLVLFEYVKTDLAGHAQDLDWAKSIVNEVMDFLYSIIENIDQKTTTLVIGSDHGNSEDLSVKSHTKNLSACVSIGPLAEAILSECNSIADITPSILRALNSSK
jgi:2,3-bisphosphoglycerate-independent phosphoglycerate mutase